MDDVNLEGAKSWTKAQADEEATRLNDAMKSNPFLSYEVAQMGSGYAVVLRSVQPSPQGE